MVVNLMMWSAKHWSMWWLHGSASDVMTSGCGVVDDGLERGAIKSLRWWCLCRESGHFGGVDGAYIIVSPVSRQLMLVFVVFSLVVAATGCKFSSCGSINTADTSFVSGWVQSFNFSTRRLLLLTAAACCEVRACTNMDGLVQARWVPSPSCRAVFCCCLWTDRTAEQIIMSTHTWERFVAWSA